MTKDELLAALLDIGDSMSSMLDEYFPEFDPRDQRYTKWLISKWVEYRTEIDDTTVDLAQEDGTDGV